MSEAFFIFCQFFLAYLMIFRSRANWRQDLSSLHSICVKSLGVVISKYINSDKKLPKTPILWNFWPKNAYYSNTVHVTLFHGMLLQKRKQFLDIFSFQYGAISITKKKTFSVIFGKNQNKILQKLFICSEIWHFWKK